MSGKNWNKVFVRRVPPDLINDVSEVTAEVEQLRAENARLRAALEPFAEADFLDDDIYGYMAKDFFDRAREALKG